MDEHTDERMLPLIILRGFLDNAIHEMDTVDHYPDYDRERAMVDHIRARATAMLMCCEAFSARHDPRPATPDAPEDYTAAGEGA